MMDRNGKYHEQNRKYYLKHKKILLEKRKASYDADSKQQYNQEYYSKNKDKVNAKKKEYYIRNREKFINAQREYNRTHRKEQSAWVKQYRSTKKGKLITQVSSNKRRACKVTTDDGTITSKYIKGLLLNQKRKCKSCNVSLISGYHIDHIIPLSKGGLHSTKNIQLLCPRCNLSKGNKVL